MERVHCVVPGCRRTRKRVNETDEWICGTHWPAVSKHIKRILFHNRRRVRKYGWSEVRWKIERKLWERCKVDAIEKAVGL